MDIIYNAIADLKCWITSDTQFNTTEEKLVFRATRQIVGDKVEVKEGLIFFATVAMNDKNCLSMIETNKKQDAKLVAYYSKTDLELMAIVGKPYIKKYLAMSLERRTETVSALVYKLHDKSHDELCQLYQAIGDIKELEKQLKAIEQAEEKDYWDKVERDNDRASYEGI